MISKRINPRKDGKSSAIDALRYGEGLKADRETGELLDKSHRTRLGNFGLVDDDVYSGHGIAEMAELIDLAALEMQSNCDLNTRVGNDKKIAHFVVSYNQVKPSEAALRDTEDSMLAALELSKNHFATFLHNDNGYWHLHIFASRVERGKLHRGNPLWQDKRKRDKVCREIEIRHGLLRDNGLHEIDELGQIVEVPLEERIARRECKAGISDHAQKAERYSGEKTFQTWCNEIRIGDRLKYAKNWHDLHTAAAAYGCEVRLKGAGFVLCPAEEKGGVQLSKLGLKNLLAKYGAFEAAHSIHQQRVQAEYMPEPTIPVGRPLYSRWKEAKTSFRSEKIDKLNQLRASHKQAREELRQRHREYLARTRSRNKGQERASAVSVAKLELAAALTALAAANAAERQTLRKELAENDPGNTFRDFLVSQAAAGDEDALVLARKYGADEATDVSRQRERDQHKAVAVITGYGALSLSRLPITHRIERNGTVIFDLGQGRKITDSALSKGILLNAAAAANSDSIETALRFAASKFGNTLKLTGPTEFQRLSVEIVVSKGLNIKFTDPALEAYRERLVTEQKTLFVTGFQEKTHVPCPTKLNTPQVRPAELALPKGIPLAGNGISHGRIVRFETGYAVQNVGRGKQVAHDMRLFTDDDKRRIEAAVKSRAILSINEKGVLEGKGRDRGGRV